MSWQPGSLIRLDPNSPKSRYLRKFGLILESENLSLRIKWFDGGGKDGWERISWLVEDGYKVISKGEEND